MYEGQPTNIGDEVEALSARFRDIFRKEAHRRGDGRYAIAYDKLSESTKEWDRVLARWVLTHFIPLFGPGEVPPA